VAGPWYAALLAGLSRARASKQPVVVAHRERLPDPPDPLTLFAAAEARGEPRFFASGPEGSFSVLGLGAAHEIVSERADPFSDVRERARELLVSADPGVLLLGGFAFAPRIRAERDPSWRSFANARFTLPEILLTRTGSEAWLTRLARVRPSDDRPSLTRLVDTRLLDKASPEQTEPVRLGARRNADATREYEQAAAEVIGAIRREEACKVVLARVERLELSGPLSAASVLRGLRESHRRSFSFAQGFGRNTFLGATPERLVRRRGCELSASAVAGTVPRGETASGAAQLARELRTSPKERSEHAFVVRAIAEALGKLCAELEVPRVPDLLETGTVQHLHTRIRGRLQQPVHILDLAARLHPTPAVGGTPRDAALELIQKHERFDRGWYAGPLGWFNASGDGDFVVALRCGLLSGGAVQLFAGAGLVASSDPRREAAETSLKLRALREALETECNG
jgi:isochorismate synthase